MGRLLNISVEQRTGLIGLGIPVAVALIAWFSWVMMQDKAPRPAVQRSFDQVTVHWRCDDGSEFEAPGALGPQPCPSGEGNAYVVARYRCREHGEMDARLRHAYDQQGRLILAGISFIEGEWIDHPASITCPHCGREMGEVEPDVFAKVRKKGR